MSLIIKGMEMPKKWEQITITIYRDGVWCVHCDNEPHGKVIPLPDGHGDLIDRDALLNEGADISDGYDVGGFCEATEWGYSTKMIENAPAIVPAEGGTNE